MQKKTLNKNGMGIHGVNPTIKKYGKYNPFKQIKMSELKEKRFAVDISIFINRHANTSQEHFVPNMLHFLINLQTKWGLDIIIVFDGKNVPEEKLVERESRKNTKQSNQLREQKIGQFREKLLLHCWNEKGETRLVPEDIKAEFTELFKRARDNERDKVNLRDADDMMDYVNKKYQKAQEASVGVQQTHKELTRNFVRHMGFRYIQADGEAEALCASMAFNGMVDGVISGDTDCYVYGCPMLISDIKNDVATVVYLKDILDSLEITMKQFVHMCIALGTDYNKNMPKCGPKKVVDSIRAHGSVKRWREAEPQLEFHILKWKRCLEIFRPYSLHYLSKCTIRKRECDVAKLDEILKSVDCTSYTGQYISDVLQGKQAHRFQRAERSVLKDYACPGEE